MTETANQLPETTGIPPDLDVFGEVLGALRIRGSLLLREGYRPPFSVEVPGHGELAALLGPGTAGRVVAFHLVEAGWVELSRSGSPPLLVESGELVLVFGGGYHELSHGGRMSPVPFGELVARGGGCVFSRRERSNAGPVRVTCGAFVLSQAQLNPLLQALPDVLHVAAGATEGARRVRDIVSLLVAELERRDPGVRFVVARLLEILCAEAIRSWATQHQDAGGWLRAVTDLQIGKALSAFHASPGRSWSVAALARHAGLSPSRFSARFAAAAGTSAMAYVAGWRMNVASRLLVDTDRPVAAIASEIGYESLPAFSRAFKRKLGMSPAAYRSGGGDPVELDHLTGAGLTG